MKLFIGSFCPQGNEVVIDTFSPDCVRSNAFNKKEKVLYAEYLGLSKPDIEFVFKNADENTIMVVFNKSFLKGIKIPRTVKVSEIKEDAEYNPFELAKSIFNSSDRDFIFNFMCKNKPALFMPIKIMVSHTSYDPPSFPNRKATEVIDHFYGKINPEILYAMMCYAIKPDYKRRTEWRYPKKNKD